VRNAMKTASIGRLVAIRLLPQKSRNSETNRRRALSGITPVVLQKIGTAFVWCAEKNRDPCRRARGERLPHKVSVKCIRSARTEAV